MRLGYFGGSFDPPHRGHLAIAQAAATSCSLEHVLLAPTGRQPLKVDGPEASFPDRLAMVQILCKEDARLAPSTLDAPHVDGAPNYTIDALMQLAVEWPDADLFAIVGADSLQQLPRWREASRLFDLASWIVVSRPEHAFRDGLPPLLRHAQEQGRLYLLGGVNMPISSTVLRRQLHEGVEPQSDALSEEVQRYIQTHALYSGGTKTGEAADL